MCVKSGYSFNRFGIFFLDIRHSGHSIIQFLAPFKDGLCWEIECCFIQNVILNLFITLSLCKHFLGIFNQTIMANNLSFFEDFLPKFYLYISIFLFVMYRAILLNHSNLLSVCLVKLGKLRLIWVSNTRMFTTITQIFKCL